MELNCVFAPGKGTSCPVLLAVVHPACVDAADGAFPRPPPMVPESGWVRVLYGPGWMAREAAWRWPVWALVMPHTLLGTVL